MNRWRTVLNMLCRVTTLVAHSLQWGPHVGTRTQGLAYKADTAILIRMERLGCETSVSKRRGLASWLCRDLAWKDLLNNASLSERGVVFAMSTGISRSSHPRAGWGHASYTTGVPPRSRTTMPLILLHLFYFAVKFGASRRKMALSTSASGVLCQGALRTNDK